MLSGRKVGTTSSHHGLYTQGYTRCPGRKGHDDLTSSPPSSGLSPAVSLEFPPEVLSLIHI